MRYALYLIIDINISKITYFSKQVFKHNLLKKIGNIFDLITEYFFFILDSKTVSLSAVKDIYNGRKIGFFGVAWFLVYVTILCYFSGEKSVRSQRDGEEYGSRGTGKYILQYGLETD